MKRILCLAVVLCAVAGLSVSAASAKLSPVEQTWVSPVVTIYNLESDALGSVRAYEDVVVKDDGAGKYFDTLKRILGIFAVCPEEMTYVGAAPSTRLVPVDDDMVSACQHLSSGGDDLAHVIVDVRAGDGKAAAAAVKASEPQLVAGAGALAAADHLLLSIGGKSAFKA